MPTADDYALAIIAEGQTARTAGASYLQHPVITPRGIKIALATVYVEANFTMYANNGDPDSLNYPHTAVSSDANSVGLFQQRAPWWGTVAERMSAPLSAAMFYNRLAKLNYNDTSHSPGSFAQAVQQSAFPDRYDQRFPDAGALYNRLIGQVNQYMNRPDFNEYPKWCDNNQGRDGTPIDLWLIHTQEGAGDADQLADFLISTTGGPNPVSYHYTISEDPNDHGVTVVDVVDTDDASWSVGNSNDRAINLCFAGSFASWSRVQWLAQSKAIDVAAYLCVQDCQKYGITPKVIAPPYSSLPPGISDHKYCTQYLKDGNTHTDVGNNFPWDVFAAAVAKYSSTTPTTTPTPTPVPVPQPLPDPAPGDPLNEILCQTRGRWAMLGDQTLIEALAEIRDKVTGSGDAGKAGFKW